MGPGALARVRARALARVGQVLPFKIMSKSIPITHRTELRNKKKTI